MLLLIYVTRRRVGKVLRFETMEKLLLFVNTLTQKSAGAPYLVLENGTVKATYEYFATVYKKDASRINRVISEYLAGKGMEKELYYVRL